jgi:tetratricopeptide (TPR) repeat protein
VHIVFFGNCQVQTLRGIIKRFVAPYYNITTDFVDAYGNVSDSSYERLSRAEIVVAQASEMPPRIAHHHIPANATVHKVPLVSGAFLWPYQGVPHPRAPVVRYGNPPYMPEYNDRYLAKLLVDNTQPGDALANYKAFDVASAAHVGRLYELTLDSQRKIDAMCGYDCVSIIEAHLADEQLFQSAFHFGGRIARHIATTLCGRIGFDPKYARRIDEHLTDAPFVPRFVPVHPSVAKYFGMRWVRDDTLYPFLWEGGYTFDEYVVRFMEARWSAALEEGVIDAREGKPEAREKLERGVSEAPRSAEGWHELSRIVEKDGDLLKAIELQQRAVHYEPSATRLIRFGRLLHRTGDIERAASMFRRATRADPVSLPAWTLLRDTLTALGRQKNADMAAAHVTELALGRVNTKKGQGALPPGPPPGTSPQTPFI